MRLRTQYGSRSSLVSSAARIRVSVSVHSAAFESSHLLSLVLHVFSIDDLSSNDTIITMAVKLAPSSARTEAPELVSSSPLCLAALCTATPSNCLASGEWAERYGLRARFAVLVKARVGSSSSAGRHRIFPSRNEEGSGLKRGFR